MRLSFLCIVLFVCLTTYSNTAFGQDKPRTFQSAYEFTQSVAGSKRVHRYLDALQFSHEQMPMDDRWKLLDEMLAEYEDSSKDVAGYSAALVCKGYLHQLNEDYPKAFESFDTAEPFAKKCQDELPRIGFHLSANRAYAHLVQRRLKESRRSAEAALEIANRYPEANLSKNGPYRLLGVIAVNEGRVSEAVKFANQELEFGLQQDNSILCASAIQRIVLLLQTRNSRANEGEIREWLKRGEEFLHEVDSPRLEVLYAMRWAKVAVSAKNEFVDGRLERLVSLMESNKDAFHQGELASFYGGLSVLYRDLNDLEKSYDCGKKARSIANGQLAITRTELILAETEIARGEFEKAEKRLEEQREFVKYATPDLETWHRMSALVCEKQDKNKQALFHLNQAKSLEDEMKDGSVFALVSLLEKQNQSREEELRKDADQQTELLEARADLAVASRNRIGILALVGLVGLGFLFRLHFVNRLRSESQKMNENLALNLQEQSETLKSESEKRHQLELEAERTRRHEAIGQLAAGISHDFNNLLTVIINAHETLQAGESLTTLQQQLFKLSSEATARATCIARQLMSFANAEPLKVQEVSIQQWLQSTQDLLTTTLGDEIDFSVRCPAGNEFVYLDESQLCTAMINLLSNAHDALQGVARKKVSLVIEKEPPRDDQDGSDTPLGRVKFTVTDNGSGMESELLSNVLSPYVSTKEGIGIGLGLSMVAGFVERSGGLLELDSEIGVGTRVTMSFPCVASKTPLEQPTTKTTSLSGGTILVVDDNELVRVSTAALLRSAGFEVAEAESGDVAAQWLDSHFAPFLVLSDIKMPGQLNGIKLRRHINQRHPTVHVVLMTGHTTENLDPGTTAIKKPFKLDQLLPVFEAEIHAQANAN